MKHWLTSTDRIGSATKYLIIQLKPSVIIQSDGTTGSLLIFLFTKWQNKLYWSHLFFLISRQTTLHTVKYSTPRGVKNYTYFSLVDKRLQFYHHSWHARGSEGQEYSFGNMFDLSIGLGLTERIQDCFTELTIAFLLTVISTHLLPLNCGSPGVGLPVRITNTLRTIDRWNIENICRECGHPVDGIMPWTPGWSQYYNIGIIDIYTQYPESVAASSSK